jgi:hypothetical protein
MLRCMDEWTIKTPNPKCLLFYKIDLLMEFVALCLTDFIDWRYIHSWLLACELLPPCTKGIYLCSVAPLPSLWPPPPSQTKCTVYTDSVVWGGGVLNCVVDHVLQEFYTLFLTRFRTYKIASPPKTKMASKDDIKGLVSLKFLRPWKQHRRHVGFIFLNVLYITVEVFLVIFCACI